LKESKEKDQKGQSNQSDQESQKKVGLKSKSNSGSTIENSNSLSKDREFNDLEHPHEKKCSYRSR
jgi:hypothetical protein